MEKSSYRRLRDPKILSVEDVVRMESNWELVEYSRAEWVLDDGVGWDPHWRLMSVFVYATKAGPYVERRELRHLELTLEEQNRVWQRNREKGYV